MSHVKHFDRSNICRICKAEAHIINYGALSCYSCKTFFRRHAHRITTIRPCRYNGHCKIDIETRKLCTSCRLRKCFTVGMSIEYIRKEFHYSKRRMLKKSIDGENTVCCTFHKPLPQITPLDLLCNDRSSLTPSEWRLLSNVVHAVDKFSIVPSIVYMINQLNIDKPAINTDISESFNLFASFYTSVRCFITSTADFRTLTIDEQCSLFRRNLHGVYNFFGCFMLRDGGIFDNSRNEQVIVPLYGYDIVHRAKSITRHLTYDSTLVKIMHIIFAFSTNSYTVNFDKKNMNSDALINGSFRLLGSQNMYVEILWKYMLYRYTYMEAALHFAALIKYMLDLITLSADIYSENIHHQTLVDDLVEQAKNTLIISDIDTTPLWGKLK
ncbi:unnamed protein product [Adineta steineri]|uniref:Nuclear receptor domain-containing protein n=1 Tax=Adineta steineri TaxID=433720 RepID=A0A818I7W8_9BILA|nr:unnamed protein product [Adineta steineri]CAF3520236.1 unnamed protein product [Adineta steineri]